MQQAYQRAELPGPLVSFAPVQGKGGPPIAAKRPKMTDQGNEAWGSLVRTSLVTEAKCHTCGSRFGQSFLHVKEPPCQISPGT